MADDHFQVRVLQALCCIAVTEAPETKELSKKRCRVYSFHPSLLWVSLAQLLTAHPAEQSPTTR